MAATTYSFRSKVGTFLIRRENRNSWSLSIGGELDFEILGYYASDLEAAEAVFFHRSGLLEWDRGRAAAPALITQWKKQS